MIRVICITMIISCHLVLAGWWGGSEEKPRRRRKDDYQYDTVEQRYEVDDYDEANAAEEVDRAKYRKKGSGASRN